MNSWDQSPDKLDSSINRFRPLIINLLWNSGDLSEVDYILAQKIMEAQTLHVLTNNPGSFGLPISALGGNYTYLPADIASSPPGESNPLHLFRLAGAVAGTKKEFDRVGALTDDLLGSTRFRAVFKSPGAVVFDFNEEKYLEYLIMYSLVPPSLGSLAFSIRSSPQEAWQEISRIESAAGKNTQASPISGKIFSLGGHYARYLKVEFLSPGNPHVDEIQIFGGT